MNWNSTQQKLELLIELSAIEGLSWEDCLQLAESFEARPFKSGDSLAEMVFLWAEGEPLASFPARRLHRARQGQTASANCTLLCLEQREFSTLLLKMPHLAVGLWEQAS